MGPFELPPANFQAHPATQFHSSAIFRDSGLGFCATDFSSESNFSRVVGVGLPDSLATRTNSRFDAHASIGRRKLSAVSMRFCGKNRRLADVVWWQDRIVAESLPTVQTVARLGAPGDSDLFACILRKKVNAEQGLRVAPAPSADLPFRPEILDFGLLAQIEKELVRATIELLRKGDKGLCAPIGVISRSPHGDIQALLLDNASNPKGQQQQAPSH
jgi:hypothetical protein